MIDFSKAKLISTKQLLKWGWQSHTGAIYYKNAQRVVFGKNVHIIPAGKQIYADYISALWAKLVLPNRINKHPQLTSCRNKIDGYIYFHIGNKFYKTPAFPYK